MLDIIVTFVHLLLGWAQERVFSETGAFDDERSVCLFFAISSLHALLASHSDRHLLHLLLAHHLSFLDDLSLVFNDHLFSDAVQVWPHDDRNGCIVLGTCLDLLSDLFKLVSSDNGCVGSLRLVLLVGICIDETVISGQLEKQRK